MARVSSVKLGIMKRVSLNPMAAAEESFIGSRNSPGIYAHGRRSRTSPNPTCFGGTKQLTEIFQGLLGAVDELALLLSSGIVSVALAVPISPVTLSRTPSRKR